MSKVIVTHSGSFHADDVFAVAALMLIYPDAVVSRSRQVDDIQRADIVVDVGQIYDPSIGRFDHHQRGGAGVRENGIPYAAFGLIWKEYGQRLCEDSLVTYLIEEKIVMPIDAVDNGVEVSKPIYDDVRDYNISAIISSFLPEGDKGSPDEAFKLAVSFAQHLLLREIENAKAEARDKEDLVRLAKRVGGEGVLVLERFMRGKDVLVDFPGIMYVVFPGQKSWGDDKWYVKCINKNPKSFVLKKPLPETWGGKSGQEFARLSGVSDAEFCHRGRFLCAAGSKKGALELANKALNA